MATLPAVMPSPPSAVDQMAMSSVASGTLVGVIHLIRYKVLTKKIRVVKVFDIGKTNNDGGAGTVES